MPKGNGKPPELHDIFPDGGEDGKSLTYCTSSVVLEHFVLIALKMDLGTEVWTPAFDYCLLTFIPSLCGQIG